MSNKIKIITTTLVLATFVFGYAAGRGYKTYEMNMQDKMTKSEMPKMDMSEHKHESIAVAPGRLSPRATLSVSKDSMSGFNLHITPIAFYFTPQNTGLAAAQNTGHAHVFVNNVKVARAYGEWINLPDSVFKTGTNTITVSLMANNHAVWLGRDGKEATVSIEVVK